MPLQNKQCQKPVILADFEVERFHAKEYLYQFVEKLGFPSQR